MPPRLQAASHSSLSTSLNLSQWTPDRPACTQAYTQTQPPHSPPAWFKLMAEPWSMRESRSWRFTLPLAAIILCLTRHPLAPWWWRHDERKPLFHLSPNSTALLPASAAATKPSRRFLCRTLPQTAELCRNEAVAPFGCIDFLYITASVIWHLLGKQRNNQAWIDYTFLGLAAGSLFRSLQYA